MKRVLSSILILLIGISAVAQNNKYSVGRLSGTVNVGELGNAIYSLPIEIPEGLSNINPNVSICYNSFSGYGDLGMGFYVGGLSEISRTNKNLFFDGVSDVIDYKNGTDFLLDGKRLIKIANNKYTVKNELSTVVEYFKDGNYFELKKDGKTYRYHTQIFRLDGTATWNLWQVTDNFGNTIKYSYQGRIVNINVNNIYDIVFDYEFYENHIYYSRFGKQKEITTCLKQVSVKQKAKILRSYDIDYVERNGFRYISTITLKNADGESMPPIQFKWDVEPTTIQVEEVDVANHTQGFQSKYVDFYKQQVLAGDLDSDGLDDLVLIAPTQDYDGNYFNLVSFYKTSFVNDAVKFDYIISAETKADFEFGDITHQNIYLFTDIDGSGTNEFTVCHLEGASGKFQGIQLVFYDNYWPKYDCSFPLGHLEMPAIACADFKNDGKSHIFFIEKSKNEYGRYPAKLVSLEGNTDFEFYLDNQPKEVFVSDFNGDNAIDIIIFGKKGYTILYNDGNGYFSDMCKTEKTDFIDGFYIIRSGDFNGDGLMDFLYSETENKQWYFLINRGDNDGFFKTTAWTSDFYDRDFTGHDNSRFDIHILDFDCDGRSDVFSNRAQYHEEDDMWSSPWGVYDITQSYWLKSVSHNYLNNVRFTQSTYEDDALISNYTVGDFNGDGVSELLNYGYDCYNGNKNDEHTPKWHIYFNTDIRSSTNKIISVSDIYGATKFNYTFLTDKNFYHKGENQTYPMIDVIAPLAVVSSTEETNGITDNIIKKYKYHNLTANVLGKGLLGFNKIECENLYTGETTTTKINSWNTTYYTPEKITQTVIRDTFITTTETEFSITDLGGKNFFTYPSKIKNTDIYGDIVVTQNIYNTKYGYLENTQTYYTGGFYKQQLSTNYVKAGGIWQPQVVFNYQMIPGAKATFMTKQYLEYDAATGTVVKKIEHYETDKQITTEYKYDESGNLLHTNTYSDETEKFSTDCTYENQKLITTTKNKPKSVIKYDYDDFGRLISETDISNPNNSLTTSYEYDTWGNLIKTQYPDGTTTTTEKGWGKSNEQFYYVFTQQTAAPWQKTWYDILGRKTLTETITEGGINIKTYNTYDKFSNIINTKTLYGDTEFNEHYVYDNQNRVKEYTAQNGSITKYTYAKNSVAIETDGKKTSKTFDVFGNITFIDDGISTIKYTYNAACKPVKISAAGAEYTLEYDELGNRTSLTDPDGGKSTYEYDCFNNVVKQTDAEGNVTENKYQGGLLTESTCGSIHTLYNYDEYGKLLKTQCGELSTEYTYDSLNRTKSETYTIDNRKYPYSFTYDKNGLLASKSFPDNTTEYYKYDQYGNLNEILLDSITVWKLINCNLTTRTTQINGKYLKTQTSDVYGYPISTKLSYDGMPLKEMTYGFNLKNGNLIRRSGMFAEPETFDYDHADSLTKISKGQDITEIDYAENGNITFKTGLGNYEYFRKRPHALESVENTDTIIKNPLQEVEYTPFNKVETLTQYFDETQSTSITFTYDADRTRRKSVRNIMGVDITQYYLPDYEELGGYGFYQKTHYINSPDGLVGVYVTDLLGGKKLEAAFTDHLGSITALFKDTTTTFAATYDAFGNRTITIGTTAFTRGYCGVHQHYPLFDIIDMGGRMYDPTIGRFISPDPYIQDWENSQNFNRYSYCLNNPLKYTDPSGEFLQYIFGGILGGIQGFFIGKSAGLKGWKLFGSTLLGAGIGAISGGIANSVSSNATVMSNTLGLMAGSFSNSVGMSALGAVNGVNIPVSMSFGIGSVSFGENGVSFGFLGKKGNSKSENWGYFLGAMANVSDLLMGFNKSNIREVDLVTLRSKDFEGHSSIVVHNTNIGGPDDPCSIVSVGPAGNLSDGIHWAKGRNSWLSYSDHGTQKTILEPEPIWRESIKVNYGRVWNYGNKLSIKALQGRLIYSVELNSCVSYTSRALNMSGVFNIGIHPYNLAIQMWLRANGFRPSLYSYYLKN